MKTDTLTAAAESGFLDWYSLNSEIKSRCANLRGTPYCGDVWVLWSYSDYEEAAMITAGFGYGTDGGDREEFLRRVLAARLKAEGAMLSLLFGDDAEKIQSYSIQLVTAEHPEQMHSVRALVRGAALRCLVTVSSRCQDVFSPWVSVIDRAFQSCPAGSDPELLPAALR